MMKRNRALRSVTRRRTTALVFLIAVSSMGGTGLLDRPAMGVDKPVARRMPVDPKSIAAVNTAVVALTKEYKEAIKDKTPKLREKSDYFPNPAPAEITPDAIVAALEKSIGSDRVAEAYVKWQLLSAIPGPFPAELGDRAVAAYNKAPAPSAHPGLDHTALDRELYRSGISKQSNESEINTGFREVIDRVMRTNHPVLSYRNELFGRLPQTWPTILAGVTDIETRAARGIPVADFWTTLSGVIRNWATLSGNASQASSLVSELNRFKAMVADPKSLPYANVAWDDKKKSLSWKPGSLLKPETIDDTVNLVKNSAMNPGGGIKFKDGK